MPLRQNWNAVAGPLSLTSRDDGMQPGQHRDAPLPVMVDVHDTEIGLSHADQSQEPRDTVNPAASSAAKPKRTRRTAKDLYGDQPTRRSDRTAKQRDNIFTTLLPPDQRPQGDLTTLSAVFLAAATKAPHKLHRDDLVRLPRRYQDLDSHPLGKQFKEACHTELREILARGTWRLIERARAQGMVIPLKWVFLYKFDENGYLSRCKARIVVRGDLQAEGEEETYAATLAIKTFRTVMALTAKYDCDVRQLDVGNAFLNAEINKSHQVYVELPKGYVELGFLKSEEVPTMVAELDKALYGLRESPLLWYNEITGTLREKLFERTSEEACVFTNGRIIVLVYVDDILVISPRDLKAEAQQLIDHLHAKYDLREEEFKWISVFASYAIAPTEGYTCAKMHTSRRSPPNLISMEIGDLLLPFLSLMCL